MKKILITGGTGFIGRNVAERFLNMPDVRVYATYLDSEPWQQEGLIWIRADLTKKEDVEKVVKGMDVIIQAAATTSGSKEILSKPYFHVTDNAVMNSLLFRAAYEEKVPHVLFFSCSVMYQPSDIPVKEIDFDANKELVKSYFGVGWTKVYIEKMCEFYSRIGETRFTVLRHSNIYGPYDKYDLERSHVFGATITKVMTAKDGKVNVWGTGEEERDLLYVSDLVDAVEALVKHEGKKYELYNVGFGRSIAIRDLVSKIISHSGRDLTIEFDTSKPTIKTTLALDSTKAKETFGWSPRVSLDEGIEKTLAWYKEHIGK